MQTILSSLSPLFNSQISPTNLNSGTQFFANSNVYIKLNNSPLYPTNDLPTNNSIMIPDSKQHKRLKNSRSCIKCFRSNLSPLLRKSQIEAIYTPSKSSMSMEIMKGRKIKLAKSEEKIASNIATDVRQKLKANIANCYQLFPNSTKNTTKSNRPSLSYIGIKNEDNQTESLQHKRPSGALNFGKKLIVDNSSDTKLGYNEIISAKFIEDKNKMNNSKAMISNMRNKLQILENNKGNYKINDMFSAKFTIINGLFNDAILLNEPFKDILMELQSRINELYNDHNKYINNKEKEVSKLKTELESKIQYINDVKMSNDKLINEAKEQSISLNRQKELIKELMIKINEYQDLNNKAENKIEQLTLDVSDLYKENIQLAKIIKKLNMKLSKSKEQMSELKNILNENGKLFPVKQHENEIIEKNIKYQVVGKNKIKMPILDFDKLPPKEISQLKIVQYYKPNKNISNEGKFVILFL